ncbi:hypothetical protein INT45_010296 [Circinella minor]|uniref:Uncharacterized protein n=1 Tax=Circinella minor TaxID=1195481 RepID=A0A8H7S9W9_9FUNG|nr:hypothetical protein INT45_010296 [Circinella minor]
MEFNFNNKRCGRKTGGKNPNGGRKSNGPKALSNGEFMIAFGDENSAETSDSRNNANNGPVNTKSSSSRTIANESISMDSASSESINTPSEELTVVEELATVRELLEEQNPEETVTDNNVFDVGDDDEPEEADIPIPEEDERSGEDEDSVVEEYFRKIQDRIRVEMYNNADQFPQEYQNDVNIKSSSLYIATLIVINRSTAQVTGAQYNKYTVECQKAAYAIISVHTDKEKITFDSILRQHFPDHRKKSIDYLKFTKLWSQEVNGIDICYKTPEQLKNYFTKWKEIDNIKRTKNNNKEIIDKVSKDLNSSVRKRAALPAQYPSPSKAPRTSIIAQTNSSSNCSAIDTHRSISPSLIRPAPLSIDPQQLAAFMFHQLMSQQLPSSMLEMPLITRHAEQSFSSGLSSFQPLVRKGSSSNNNILKGIHKKNLKTCAICGSIECK